MQDKVRIAYMVPGREFAGVEHVVHEIADYLAAAHADTLEVHVVYCARFAELEGRAPRYRLHCLTESKLSRMLAPLIAFFRREQFDIVIAAQCEMSSLCYAALRASGQTSAFIPYLHGNPELERAASLASRALFAFFDAVVAPRAACLFAVSESLARYARAHLAGKTPVFFAPNPVRAFATEGEAAAPASFLCVARLSRQKGHDVLLDAFAQVRSQRPGTTLALVGAGEEEAALKARAHALGLDGAVMFHGRQADPAPYFRAARCFVLASRWEGFGQVLVEALSFGLPLVVTDCDFGPADIVSDARIGVVARREDADDLARAMLAALDMPSTPADLAHRRAVARGFALEAVAPLHFDFLQAAPKAKQQKAGAA